MRVLAILMLCLSFLAAPAAAQSLDGAKAAGQVGELPNGYLAAIGNQPLSILGLVDEVNAKRRQRYQEIAARNNSTLAAVEKIVGEKMQSRGDFVAAAGFSSSLNVNIEDDVRTNIEKDVDDLLSQHDDLF